MIKKLKRFKVTFISGNNQVRTVIETAKTKLGAKQKIGRILANVKEYKKVEEIKKK